MGTNDKKGTGIWVADSDGTLEEVEFVEAAELFPSIDLAGLSSHHGELVVCRTKAGVAVFRCPKGSEYDRFLGGLLDDRKEQKVKAGNILARTCVVEPDKETFGAWLAQYPGIPSACTKPLNKLMGGELQARGKE